MEQFELVDINGNKTGTIINAKVDRGEASIPDGEYIQVVKVIIINEDKKILLQKRSMNKVAKPGLWGLHGGKVNMGEDTLTTAIRETFEEIGINLNKEKVKYLCQYYTKKVALTIYYIKQNVNIEDCKIDTKELDELKYFSLDDIEDLEKIEDKRWVEKIKPII